MLKAKNPKLQKLEKMLNKNPLTNSRILHYTGQMWGIGARLSAIDTIKEILTLKRRYKPGLQLLIPSIDWFQENGITVNERLYKLMQQYYPGNVSFAFKVDKPGFEHVAVEGKVAFRVPSDELLREFIRLLNEPLISTSINISGMPPEEDIKLIEKNYTGWFDFALYPAKDKISASGQQATLIEYFEKTKDSEEDVKCIREGSVPFYGIKHSFRVPMVMFVCTANICRSPIAEYLFRELASEAGIEVQTDSSGLMEGGHMISVSSLKLLLERGILEAKDHISQKISPEMVENSWLILTMEERQRNILHNAYPIHKHKIKTLNEITGHTGDIEDPYGSDLDFYTNTFQVIEDRLKKLIKLIKENKIIHK